MPPKKADPKKGKEPEVVELPPEEPAPEWYQPWNGVTFVVISHADVNAAPTLELLKSKTLRGFEGLNKEEILKLPVDEELANAHKTWVEEHPEEPVPLETYTNFLKAHLAVPVPRTAPPAISEDDPSNPVTLLAHASHAPQRFYLLEDFSETAADLEALCDAGVRLDCVFYIKPKPKVAASPEPGAEGGTADGENAAPAEGEAPAAPAEGEAVAEDAENAEENADEPEPDVGELLLAEIKRVGRAEKGEHALLADAVFFTVEVDTEVEDTSKEATTAIAQNILDLLPRRREYEQFIALCDVQKIPAEPCDTRHYNRLLQDIPDACVSVPLVLHCMIEQVVLNGGGDVNETAVGGVMQQNRLERLLDNALDDIKHGGSRVQAQKGPQNSSLLRYHDSLNRRLAEPGLDSWQTQFLERADASMLETLTLDWTMPAESERLSEAEVGQAHTQLHHYIPSDLPPAQVQHGLLLLQMEEMLGRGHDGGEGLAMLSDGGLTLGDLNTIEEHDKDILPQVVARALENEPEMLSRYYPLEDVCINVTANLVPFDRTVKHDFKPDFVALLGFCQWLEYYDDMPKIKPDEPEVEDPAAAAAAEAEAAAAAEAEAAAEEAAAAEAAAAKGGKGKGKEPAKGKAAAKEPEPEPEPAAEEPGAAEGEGEAAELTEEEKAEKEAAEAAAAAEAARQAAHEEFLKLERLRLLEIDHEGGYIPLESTSFYMADNSLIHKVKRKDQFHIAVRTNEHVLAMHPPEAQETASVDLDDMELLEGGQEVKVPHCNATVTYEDGAVVALRQKEDHLTLHCTLPNGLCIRVEEGTITQTWASRVLGKEGATGDAAPAVDWYEYAVDVAERGPWPDGCVQVEGDLAKQLEQRATEASREILSTGTVISRGLDNSQHVMLADGNVARRLPGGDWIITNNAGHRMGRTPAGTEFGLAPVTVTSVTDVETQDKTDTRSDLVLIVRGAGGSRLVQHADGTQHYTEAPGSGITHISHPDYATVQVGPGACRQVTYRDGTLLLSDTRGLEVRRSDGSCLSVNRDGTKVCFVEARETYASREPSSLLSDKVPYRPGVFHMDLLAASLTCSDAGKNTYEVCGTSEDKVKVQRVLDFAKRQEEAILAIEAMRARGSTEKPPEPEAKPGPNLEPVRVFITRRDGSGYELVPEGRAKAFTAVQADRGPGALREEEVPTSSGGGTSYSCVSADWRWVPAANIGEQILPLGMRYKTFLPDLGRGSLITRHLIHTPVLAADHFKVLRGALEKYRQHSLEAAEAADALVIEDTRTPEEIQAETEVQERIMAARAAMPKPSFDPNEAGGQFRQANPPKERPEMKGYSRKYTQDTSGSAGRSRPSGDGEPHKHERVLTGMTAGQMRPGYFHSDAGSEYLAENPPGPPTTKRKGQRAVGAEEQAGDDMASDEDDDQMDFGEHNDAVEQMMQQVGAPEAPDDSMGDMSASQVMYEMSHDRSRGSRGSRGIDGGTQSRLHMKLRPAQYDVRNRARPTPVRAPSIKRDGANSIVNARFSQLELPVRRRTSTSSVLQRQILASSKTAVESMASGVELEPPPHRQFQCNPRVVNFGVVQAGTTMRFRVSLTNVGDDLGRFRIVQPTIPGLSIIYNPGPVAAGMMVQLIAELTTKGECDIQDAFSVVTEFEIFSISVIATVLNEDDFAQHAMSSKYGMMPPPRGRLQVVKRKEEALSTAQMAAAIAGEAAPGTVGSEEAAAAAAVVDVPSTEADWVVDPNRSLAQIKAMSRDDRMKVRSHQAAPHLYDAPQITPMPDTTTQESKPQEQGLNAEDFM